jgi:hypothetical protein
MDPSVLILKIIPILKALKEIPALVPTGNRELKKYGPNLFI